MPIEFPCEQCRKTLRIPDDAAGKLARCPKCGHVGRAPVATMRYGGDRHDNPYASPTMPTAYYDGPAPLSDLTYRLIRNKVDGPAVGLIILGGLHLLLLAIMLATSAEMAAWNFYGIFIAAMAVKGGVMIAGGWQMKILQGYRTAMAAAVLALIPCCFCYVAELPIGIWAIVVLSNPHVKRAFDQRANATY